MNFKRQIDMEREKWEKVEKFYNSIITILSGFARIIFMIGIFKYLIINHESMSYSFIIVCFSVVLIILFITLLIHQAVLYKLKEIKGEDD